MPSRRDSPPPTPEDVLAAQLEQLGEIGGLTSAGHGHGKGKGNKKKSGGGGSSSGSGSGGAATGASKGDFSSAPCAVEVSGRGSGAGGGGGGGEQLSGSSGGEGVVYCSACGRQYSAGVVEDSVARAKSSW